MSRDATGERGPADSVDPSYHSPIVSENRVRSLEFAVAGCRYMLRWQKNTRLQALATLLAALLAFWLRVSALELAILVLTIALVWLAEFINAAIEATVNLVRPEIHPMARVAKDVAAGAVLLAATASLIIGALVLGPPLVVRLGLASAGA